MQGISSIRRLLLAMGAGMLAVTIVAGVYGSLRAVQRFPAVDLFVSGSKDAINQLLANKDFNGAIEQLQMQTKMLPFDWANYEYLGNVLGSQGRAKDAQLQFQQLVSLRPDYAPGHNFLGATYLDTGQPDQASACFVQAIKIDPEFPIAYNNLGIAMAQLGKLREAEFCFSRAVQLAPDYEEARRNLERAREQRRQSP